MNNIKLAMHTKKIERLIAEKKRNNNNMFEVAVRLVIIRDENLIKEDGFKDVFDYSEKMFGYKKSLVYKLLTVAEKFIEVSPTGEYKTIFIHEKGSYNITQLFELNSLDPFTALELDLNGVISPSLSAKEIREIIKRYRSGEITIMQKIGGEEQKEDVKRKARMFKFFADTCESFKFGERVFSPSELTQFAEKLEELCDKR